MNSKKLKFSERLLIKIIDKFSNTWDIDDGGFIPPENCILAFWHDEMLPIWKSFAELNPKALVSQSKDGEILSSLLHNWGFELIRGSSSKGGKEALDLIVSAAESGIVMLTPDGPRGPRHKFKAGAVVAAQRAATNLILCRAKIERKIVFKKSWDKFILPLPFAKVKLFFSDIYFFENDLPRDIIEQKILEMQNVLNKELI